MDDLVIQKKRKLVEPQMISMIAIFSMLILFLIAGTVFGTSSIHVPTHYDLAESVSKESINLSPQLLFSKEGIKLSYSDTTYPLSIFSKTFASHSLRKKLVKETRDFISRLPEATKQTGVSLNVIAERSESYRVIFDVLSVMRPLGMENVLFISRSRESVY